MTRQTYTRLFDPQEAASIDRLSLIELGRALVCDRAPLRARDESRIPSAYTYFGQFIAHDMSFDDSKGLPETRVEPCDVPNRRRSGLNLTSLYGRGPDGPHGILFRKDGIRLRHGHFYSSEYINGYDLPRLDGGEALIADERNEETVTIAQLHACLIAFHNRVADYLEESSSARTKFDTVRTAVVQHYHSTILYDYLWRIVPDDIYRDVLMNGRKLFHPDNVEPGMELPLPVEFTHAAFRFGHAMVRAQYKWNRVIVIMTFEEMLARSKRNGPSTFSRLDSDWFIDWRNFVDFSGVTGVDAWQDINFARKIDATLTSALGNLPHGERAHGEPANLAARDLLRGQSLGLPSGQNAVTQMRRRFGIYAPRLGAGDFERLHNKDIRKLLISEPLASQTPLWLYILAEAEIVGHGEKLGPLGGRIVMEVIHALLEVSDMSIIGHREWRPTLPHQFCRFFTLANLIEFAGMRCGHLPSEEDGKRY